MSEIPESEWRCPTDGAFHVLDLSKENNDTTTYLCTKCGKWKTRELLDNGMANALEQHLSEKPAPEKPYILADLDAFNAALKDWFQATYPYRMGESICSRQFEEYERGLKFRQVKSMDEGCCVPRIPSGLSWGDALIWCQNFILSRLPETMVRHIARSYPEVSHHVIEADPDFETEADDFYGLRFRIYVVEEKPQDIADECRDLYGHRIAPERWESLPADTKEYLRLVNTSVCTTAHDVCCSSAGSHSHQLQGTWGISPVEQARAQAEAEDSLRLQQYSEGVAFPKELTDDFNCSCSSNGRALQTKVISDSNSDITYSVSYERIPPQSFQPGDMVALTSTGKIKKAGSGDTARGWFITPNASVSVAGGPLVYISGSSGTGATASYQSYDPIIRGPSFYHGSNTFKVSFEWLEENGFERLPGGKVSFAGGNGVITMIDHDTQMVTVTCDNPLSDGGVEVHKSSAVGPSTLSCASVAALCEQDETDSDCEFADTFTIPTDLRVPDNFHVQECLCVRMEFNGHSVLDTETWTTAVGAQTRAKQLLFGCEEIRACEIVTVWRRGE